MPDKPSQLSFERGSNGIHCLVYHEDTSTKTNDGGLKQMPKERKIVWIYPNTENLDRCPVRIVDKYISLCPAYYKKANFYLQSLQNINPAQWYGEQVVGIDSLKKVVKNLLGRANMGGYFTNHSLRCTGGTRLFQAGVERKIVKEITGHVSDAVDAYQITSEMQRKQASNVLAGIKFKKNQSDVVEVEEKEAKKQEIPVVSSVSINGQTACSCKKTYSPDSNNWSEMLKTIVESNRKGCQTTIKIEVEISDK